MAELEDVRTELFRTSVTILKKKAKSLKISPQGGKKELINKIIIKMYCAPDGHIYAQPKTPKTYSTKSNITVNSSIHNHKDLVDSLSHKQRCLHFMDGYIRTFNINKQFPMEIKSQLICELYLGGMKFIRSYTEIKTQKERESKLKFSTQKITFYSKPLGFTIFPGTGTRNGINARITRIKQWNKHIADGLRVGLYIHMVNDDCVDNMLYNDILHKIRALPAPCTLVFIPYQPFHIDNPIIASLLILGYTIHEIKCALHEFELSRVHDQEEMEINKLIKILSKYAVI
eukprot:489639_1